MIKRLLLKLRKEYNGKHGYRNYIGFYESNNKLIFTTKGLTFKRNK